MFKVFVSDQTTIEVKPIVSIIEETDLKCDDCSFIDEDLIKLAWMYNLEEE